MTTPSCPQCGEPVAPGGLFCSRCGQDVSAVHPAVDDTVAMTAVGAGDMPAPAAPVRSTLRQALRDATLGEYEIMNELGRGGMATVFLAHDISLDRKVAIKVMAPHLLQGEGMAERFKLEARTAAQLSHPHIIPIYAVKETAETLFFVMKFVEGRPLDDIIKKSGQLPIPMVKDILVKVGSALGYAHRRHVVHRDIKPGNVMIDEEGIPVVTDFGIAKVAQATGLTQTGTTIGTPSYMSPEQCEAKEVTGASDQYSLGVVAFEMLTGKLPFEGDSAVATMYKHCHEPLPPLEDFRPDCPPEVVETVTRMLAKKPAERWPTMEAAIRKLGAASTTGTEAVRSELIALARETGSEELLARLSDPTLRAAGAGATGTRRTAAAPAASGGRSRAWMAAAAVVVVIGSGAVAMWAPWKAGAATEPDRNAETAAGGTGGDAVSGGVTPPEGDLAASGTEPSGPGTSGPAAGAGSTDPPTEVVAGGPAGGSEAAPGGSTGPSTSGEGRPQGADTRSGPSGGRIQVRNVSVQAMDSRVYVGARTNVTAEAQDQRGSVVPASIVDACEEHGWVQCGVAWTSSSEAVGTVDAAGTFVARSVGTTTVTAVIAGVSGSTVITVDAVPVSSVAIAPGSLTLEMGTGGSLRASVLGPDRAELSERAVQWSSGDASIAGVDPSSGAVRGLAPGTTTVTATAEGVQGTARIVVLPDAPTAIAGLVTAWSRALETRDVAAIRRAFPDVVYDEKNMAAFFGFAEGLRAELAVAEVTEQGDRATAGVTGTYRFNDSRAGRQEIPVSATFDFARASGGWALVKIENR